MSHCGDSLRGGETCDQSTFNVTKGRFAQYPSKFDLPIPNIFCGLVTRWIPEINPNYLKNFLPSSRINNNLPCRGWRIRRENSFNCRDFFFSSHHTVPAGLKKKFHAWYLSLPGFSPSQTCGSPHVNSQTDHRRFGTVKKSKALIKHSPGTLPHLCGGTT